MTKIASYESADIAERLVRLGAQPLFGNESGSGAGDKPDKGANDGPSEGADEGLGVAIKARPKTKKPSMWRVLLMNDDYTPMEFVVLILTGIFNKSPEEATQIMLSVHRTGVGTCGVYTFEIAETKVAQVMDSAKRAQHPLQCKLEKA